MVGIIKRITQNLGLQIPTFDTIGWGAAIERNMDTIDAVIYAGLGIGNIRGVWFNATVYTAGDRVVDGADGTIWQCMVTHTSAATGSFAAARVANPTYWDQVSGPARFRGIWMAGTAYVANEFVYYGNRYGIVMQKYTSGATFDADVVGGKIQVLIDLTADIATVNNYKSQAQAAASTATTQAGIATTQAGTATSQATLATNRAAAALASQNAAADSQVAANNSANAAAGSAGASEASRQASVSAMNTTIAARDATLAAFDSFDDRYLGAKANDPTVDNDGNPLVTGSLYYNTTISVMKVWDGSAWRPAYVTADGVLVAINNLSDVPDKAAARTNLNVYGIGDYATLNTKTTPANGDGFLLSDSAAAGVLKRITWSNLIVALRGLFDNTWHGNRGGGDLHTNATSGADGFMSAANFTALATLISEKTPGTRYAMRNAGDGFALHANMSLQGLYFYNSALTSAYEIYSSYSRPISQGAVATTLAERDASGDIHARLMRSTFADGGVMQNAFVMRQNNSTDNYLRPITWTTVATHMASTGPLYQRIEDRAYAYALQESRSPTNIGIATAGLGAGAVGSYALMCVIPQVAMGPGSGAQGSDLYYSAASVPNTKTTASGSWRCMGRSNASSSDQERTTLYLRYA